MIEIAISLAIIGFALASQGLGSAVVLNAIFLLALIVSIPLYGFQPAYLTVAIIGVLPLGLNTQRVNREQTVINQDATVFMEDIRNGVRGADDLTNYVYAITNERVFYKNGTPSVSTLGYDAGYLTTGARIVGLMSSPEYTDVPGDPISVLNGNGVSNHVVAYVRSISGPAFEKPPQDNPILQQDSFSYRIYCVNAPVAVDTNAVANPGYTRQFAANLRELRLTFLWPVLPNGKLPAQPFRATYRTLVAGGMTSDKSNGQAFLYFYQPQSFITAP